jgi:MFS transporter, DHA1 family, multidrug resistance protein
LFVWRRLPETLRAPAAGPFSLTAILAGYAEILRNRAVLAYIGMLAASFAGVFAWISGSSFVLQEIYGLSALSYGLAFGAASAGYLAGTALATRIVIRLGLDRTIGLGAVVLAIGGLGSVMAVPLGNVSAIPLVAAMTVFAAGMGLVQPQTIAGAMLPFPHRAGTASSLVGVSQMVCAAASGAIVGHFLGSSAWPVAVPLAITGCLTLVIWALSRDVRAREARHDR